jgi:hypothetical protein
MRIILARPPNYNEIAAAFPVEGKPVLFCYGDAIFNPMAVEVTPELAAHEQVHSLQQGNWPAQWWHSYLASSAFRLVVEVPAHQVEWHTFCALGHNRRSRGRFLSQIAKRLASPLYGSLVSSAKAKRLILGIDRLSSSIHPARDQA